MLVMLALSRLPGLSVYGVSIGGAAGHNIGQMAAALITLGNTAVLGYLPFLLVVSPVHRGPDGLRVGPAAAGHQPCEVIRLKESG